MHAMTKMADLAKELGTIDNLGKISDFGDILPISSN